MDAKLAKAIVKSSEEVLKDLESANEWKSFESAEELCSLTSIVIGGISKSLTDLLSYKVCHEARQRHQVRQKLIETLRDWIRFQGSFHTLRTFMDHDRTNAFVIRILKRYLSHAFLKKTDSADDLTCLANAISCLTKADDSLNNQLCQVIERIVEIEQSQHSETFLQYITRELHQQLRLSTVENIYSVHSEKFVKEPIKKSFQKFWNNESAFDEVDYLFEILAESPTIFFAVSTVIANEIISVGNLAATVRNFVQLFLEQVQKFCEKVSKDIIDLYPKHLRSCVILLRIPPRLHSTNSKQCAFEMWKDIFLNSQNESKILLSHYPDWNIVFHEFFENIDKDS